MKRKRLYKIVFFTFALLIFSLAANAQYNSEEDMKKAANQLFNEENYIEALPLFSQLLSTYPKDVNYNYKYGASALFAKNDKEKPLRYLKFAASKANVDPLAYYFLAKAQHLNYNFDAAILYYNKFKEKGNSRDIQRFEVSRQIEMCENGKKLLKSVVDIGVIDKKEIKETEFFRSYHLKGIDGKVTVKPDDFMSKLDKKKKENSLIYIGGTKDKIIFSSYGKTENSGRDLFSIERVPGGGWTEPTTLGLSINTKYDENYPFLHPDGKTLYFCSKGYNSMGGYDIFKSVYNSATGTWSKPENLDFPINTPGDDVMYISDEDNKLAYFASSRASKQGKMIVYHVTVDSKPDNKSVIKGMFLAEENPSMKSATITIRDVEKDRRYAVYTTHEVTGEYMLVFPTNGGKFKILVETTNEAPVHSAIIEIPPQDDFRALKQELILVGSGDDEKLVVKNLFDESDEFSIADPLYVEHVLKKKANLDVNTTEEEVFDNSLQASLLAAQTEEEATSVYANLSDKELLNQSNTKANELKAQTTKSKEQANFAYQEANTKSAEAKKIFAEAQNEPNETVATTKKQAAADLINETVALLAVARSLESEANERESDVANINKLQKEINTAIDAGNRAEAEEKATKLDEIASATYQQESILDTELALKEEALATKEKAYHKDRANVIESTNRKFEIEKNINDLEAKKSLTKKKKEIEDYTTQLEALKIDLEDAEFDLDKAKAEEQKSKDEYIVAKNELITTKKVKSNVASSNNIVAELDDANKLRIEGDIAYLDKEGVVGNYAKNTTTETNVIEENNNNTPVASTYNVADEKEVYNIVNNEGKLIDYNTNYKKELEAIAVVQNEKEKQAMTIQVNEDWIAAIDEEIEIREKQKASITSNEEKNELDGMITELKARKLEKREAIAGMNIVAETNVTNNSEENNTTATNTSLENTNESNLNYEESFAAELEQFSGDDTYETYIAKAAIHTKWIAEIDKEIGAKQAELATAAEDEKSAIGNQLAILENDKLEQEEFVSIYEMQAETMTPAVAVVNNNNEKNIEEENNNTENGNVENSTTSNNTESETNTNYVADLTTELEQIKEEDTYEAYTAKAAIHTKWVEAIDTEISSKQTELATADENEKSDIENQIAILESNKQEQQEFVDVYELQAEAIAETAVVVNNNNEESNSETVIIDNNRATNNSTVAIPTVNTENLTANNLNGEEDEFSNLKYNNKYTYKSSQSANVIGEATSLKIEAAQLEVEANDLLLSTSEMTTQEEKDAAIDKSDELSLQSEKKQEEIAKIYENANRSEFHNNESILSQLKKANSSISEQNGVVAEMIADESVIFYNQAKESRVLADNASSFTTKENHLQKAYELEMKAIERQNKAIALYTASGDENVMAITENNTNNERTSDPVINTSNNSSYPINTDVAVSPSNNTNNSTESANANTVAKNEAYEPLSISLPSTDVTARANRLVKEAEVLNAEAKILTDSAATIKKKKEKTPLLVKAEEMKAESQRKIKEAEVLYAEAETMKVKEVDVAQQLSTNRTAIASEKLTNTEKEEVTNLSAATVNAVINSNNYQDYAEAKKETRRLIKSAEVEYIKADEVQQEADEQKTLGLSLNAMMAGAQTSTEKEKLAGQIDKLNAMIAENEEEAATLRKSATKKEQEALLQKEKTDLILINASEEDAKNIVAIEKVAVFDAALFTKINNKTDELANNQRTINENRNVDENATETTNESGTVIEENNNTEIANNQTEEVNETVTVSNIDDNITVEQPTDIDVVPAVLRQSIFKIGGNQASYSNSNPIPSVSTLPKGVVFKVQIGAFRNPIPQNHFKGFAPIVKEDAGNGITRYTAGLFKGINMAVEAKNAIRSIGYSDAFVVAFYNGKRISIAEARAKLGEGANETLVNNTSNNASSNNNSQNTTTNNSPNNTTIVETEEVNDGVSTDVRNITGAFFTIQVGVYSKPVSANQLRNVTPLNSERTASGLIRYTSGVYKTLYEANAAKDRIRSLGISDAFVVAYNGGQKITVAQANNMLSSTETPTTKETPTAVEPIEENVVEDEDTPVIVPTIEDIETPIIEDKLPQETTSDATNALIEYKVQLGAYEEEVPVEDAGIFLRLTGRGVKNFEEDGKTIYTIGSFPDYNSALDLQIEMKELGVKKPKVLAFKNGNMITVEEALEIQKNN